MLLFLLVIQMALWAYAATVVEAAASQGDYAACLYGSSTADGKTQAEDLLSTNTHAVVLNAEVQVRTIANDLVEVQVTGVAEPIIPWLHLPVASTQVGMKQEFQESR